MSSPNASLPPPLVHSFPYPHFYQCSTSSIGAAAFTSFTVTSCLFLLPLSALVLVTALQRRSASPASISHSDFLTYNIVAMEPVGLLASGIYSCGIYAGNELMMKDGIFSVFVIYLGRLLFQCLTCVEQYLAVIHPVAYLKLRTDTGIRIRNGVIVAIWLLCSALLVFVVSNSPVVHTVPFFCIFAVSLVVISICSLSVILALVRPAAVTQRVDQSKRKAFLTILAITVVMLLKYTGLLVCTAVHASSLLDYASGCVVLMSAFWFCLPSSLSLPLLFLHRAGKLPCLSEV